jgi:hypothetical protein
MMCLQREELSSVVLGGAVHSLHSRRHVPSGYFRFKSHVFNTALHYVALSPVITCSGDCMPECHRSNLQNSSFVYIMVVCQGCG